MSNSSHTRRDFLMLGSSLLAAAGSIQAFASERTSPFSQNSAMKHTETKDMQMDIARPSDTKLNDIHRVTSKDGTVIGYQSHGSGRPLLFVHGTTGDRMSWSAIAPQFGSNVAVYAMDRRGRGASGDSPDYEFMREAEDVAAVADAIDEPVCLFGHSFGGLCGLEGALLMNNISRLILYEPPVPTGVPTIPQGIPERIQDLVDQGDLEAAMEMFLREVAQIPEHELEAYRRSPLWNARIPLAATISRELSVERTYRFDAERFAGLQVPTMLLTGSDSPPVYREATEILHAALPDSTIVVLPGQQHLAHHTNPELLVEEVLGFMFE